MMFTEGMLSHNLHTDLPIHILPKQRVALPATLALGLCRCGDSDCHNVIIVGNYHRKPAIILKSPSPSLLVSEYYITYRFRTDDKQHKYVSSNIKTTATDLTIQMAYATQ